MISDTKYVVWQEGTVSFVVENQKANLLISNGMKLLRKINTVPQKVIYFTENIFMWMALLLLLLSEM